MKILNKNEAEPRQFNDKPHPVIEERISDAAIHIEHTISTMWPTWIASLHFVAIAMALLGFASTLARSRLAFLEILNYSQFNPPL